MKSMTGFGAGSARLASGKPGGAVSVEIRSVNQRFLDLKLSLPKEYGAFEAELRKTVQESAARGRLEIYVSRSLPGADRTRLEIDEEAARGYVEEWRRIKRKLRLPGEVDLSFLKGLSELYRPREADDSAASELAAVRRALAAALAELDRSRLREGKHLESDMRARIRTIEALADGMAERAAAGFEETRRRIAERMRELLNGHADESRILQEAAFQAEKSDVTEEIVRLRSHLAGLGDLCEAAEPIGKKLEFLLQEVGREVNTIASKSSDLGLTQLAVDAKSEVEKIREQVQNVE